MLVHHPAGGSICWFSGLRTYFYYGPELDFYCVFAGLFFNVGYLPLVMANQDWPLFVSL